MRPASCGQGGRRRIPAVLPGTSEWLSVTAAPPALDSLAVTITSAGPASAFPAHTHRIEQIVGLPDAFAELNARVDTIERLLPRPNLLGRAESGGSREIEIPDRSEIFSGARPPQNLDIKQVLEGKIILPRAPGLLPAVHDATVQPLVTPLLPATGQWGEVFQNNTGAPIIIPGGLGQRISSLPDMAYLASDGRAWFRVVRGGATNSFFPAAFNQKQVHHEEHEEHEGGKLQRSSCFFFMPFMPFMVKFESRGYGGGFEFAGIVVVPGGTITPEAFGTALSLATDRSIHLHLLDGLPWHHPYHLCIRWLNCNRLPMVCVPRGATIVRHQSDSAPCRTRIALSAIPHFVGIDTPPAASPQVATTFIVAPPLGGFLL